MNRSDRIGHYGHSRGPGTSQDIDPRTPVIVGVGQVSERIGDRTYRRRSPVQLAADAAEVALADTGLDPRTVAARIDTVAGVRQFEISTPTAEAPLGRASNYPRAVAQRLGAAPRRAVLDHSGGQSPQHLVNEFAAVIAAGASEVVLVFGSEAISTVRHEMKSDAAELPSFTEQVEGSLEDRGYGLGGMTSRYQTRHGLTDASSRYALFDNARRAALGMSKQQYTEAIGQLLAPLTRVAENNPHAATTQRRNPADITAVTTDNRRIADPYTRLMIARDQVNQGAAVLIMSISAASRLGVPPTQWVFLHGHADLREHSLLARTDLGAGPAATMASQHALDIAGISVADIATFDLYSCYPIAMFNICDGLGLAIDDPRGLTTTGGLPYFGGPGNNYSMHAIAETVQRLRARPGSYGFVGANGGALDKYSVGIYSTRPAPWRPDRSATLQSDIDSWTRPEVAAHADGWARIESYTITHTREGLRTGIVVGRLDADGRRFLAKVADNDDTTLALLDGPDEPIGTRIYARSSSTGNRVTLTSTRADTLFPIAVPTLRTDYEYLDVQVNGRILEVTINRPEVRNSLNPPASEELDQVFDAYFADQDLWVAILTGAGQRAFSAGNDLAYSASGAPSWVPRHGFGGITARRSMPKPVIAAVNGFAMGGGFEIVLACHLVVADTTASFALSEVKVGAAAGAGGLVRLPRTLPRALANEMILTGRRLTADEALAHGIVNRVAEAGTAIDGARLLATEILDGSPTSVRASLQIMAETSAIADVSDAMDYMSPAFEDLFSSADMREGIAAFIEKRKPEWHNR